MRAFKAILLAAAIAAAPVAASAQSVGWGPSLALSFGLDLLSNLPSGSGSGSGGGDFSSSFYPFYDSPEAYPVYPSAESPTGYMAAPYADGAGFYDQGDEQAGPDADAGPDPSQGQMCGQWTWAGEEGRYVWNTGPC